ncbi:hypothetical protein MSC49_31710 [Methylosinus sp. C49]|uniref:glycosyltransferase family 4 protein n=1 Tax=Methylosinus sp. C49 TaxID=2699395 RepID=UPI001367861B|nr:glycosyltransferase family 4 protein [Methylosinus sp. C49]BBU63236.1 hypothetical protein MSC49_31710 [Methylosinus sp. C49]
MLSNVGVFHPGTQHSWQVARALQQNEALAWYATQIFYSPDRWPYRIERYLPEPLRSRLHAEFMRFHHPALKPEGVLTVGALEWVFRIAQRMGQRRLALALSRASNRNFGRKVADLIRETRPDIVWGFDTASLEVFEAAAQLGIPRILDKTIGDPRTYNRIISEVYEQFPAYFSSPDFKLDQSVIDRTDREYDLADIILAGSEHCRDAILDPCARPDLEDKISILPYCYDDVFFADAANSSRKKVELPVRFLFCGQAGPRKGIHLVLEAIERIPPSAASLTILGDIQIPDATFRRFADRVSVHSTVARSDVPRFMAEADCLLFPSYFEGAGLVLYEALAVGLGIIQSRSGDIVVKDDCGIRLDELTVECLYSAMCSIIDNTKKVDTWKLNSRTNVGKYQFIGYSKRIEALVRKKIFNTTEHII